MADNMRIDTIPANSFQGITEEYVDMWVQEPDSFLLPPYGKCEQQFVIILSMCLSPLM